MGGIDLSSTTACAEVESNLDLEGLRRSRGLVLLGEFCRERCKDLVW
jgi:hypothetical protein